MTPRTRLPALTAPNVGLGKAPKRTDPRTLQMARYLRQPRTKPSIDWTLGIAGWPMMGNDQLGDCVPATAGHLIELWTAHAAPPGFVPSDAAIIAAYSAVAGYVPGDPSTDRGTVELDLLNWWRTHGIAGHKIAAYAEVQPSRPSHVRFAVETFGGAFLGLALPLSAQQQYVWDVARGRNAQPGSWGGHAVPAVAYDALGLTIVTWGGLRRMTWGFFRRYCDEAYAVLSADWLDAQGRTPEGFDLATLQADLAAITK